MMLDKLGALNAFLIYDIFQLMMDLLGYNPNISLGKSVCCFKSLSM